MVDQIEKNFGKILAEDFETIASLDNSNWFANSFDTVNKWQITNTTSYAGTKSIMLDNYNNVMATKDELYSEIIDLTGATALNLTFKYAYAKKLTTNNDRLQLYITNNCNNAWLQRLNLMGDAIETAPVNSSPFIPFNNNEWRQTSVVIPLSFMTSGFRFKFVFSSSGGNNFYIDDINIDVNAGINYLDEVYATFQLFPNPTIQKINISFLLLEEKKLSLSILNILGQSIFKKDKENYTALFRCI